MFADNIFATMMSCWHLDVVLVEDDAVAGQSVNIGRAELGAAERHVCVS